MKFKSFKLLNPDILNITFWALFQNYHLQIESVFVQMYPLAKTYFTIVQQSVTANQRENIERNY